LKSEKEDLELKINDIETQLDNIKIKKDLGDQNSEMKIKLLEEALTRRNNDVEMGEENNK
jgi:hypothetical protein